MTRKPRRQRPPPITPVDRSRRRASGGRVGGSPDRRIAAIWGSVAVTALALLLTIDDRYPGAIADGRQMVWTAVAMVETGEIGQARGRDFTWARAEGDAVSRYGMGMSLAQVPAAWLAPELEAKLGPGTSQPIFLVAPLLFVCLSALAAGWIALSLGLGRGGVVAAVVLSALGSPLGAYAALDLSEPLQAASLSLALACAVASTQPRTGRGRVLRYSALAGFAAGVAVLTKSSLLLAVPFALLPVISRDAPVALRERLIRVCGGGAGPLALWLYFEIVRFGRPFASYPGEGFTHWFPDGLWRLLVGPNRGMLLYFPALCLAVAAAVVWRRDTGGRRTVPVAATGSFGVLLALAAGWWAWHGLWGWGPRLLIPAVPALAAAAAMVLDRWPSSARNAFLLGSIAINVLGVVQNAAAVTMFTSSCRWPSADAAFAARLAPYARRTAPDGTYRVAPDQILETVPRASPFLLYPWFLRSAWAPEPSEATRRLSSPPWAGVRPDISCLAKPNDDFSRRLLRRPGWTMWGRGLSPDPDASGFPGVYDEGLLDQVVRAQQLGRGEQALALALKLSRLVPSGDADAQVLESLRILRRRPEAVQYLATLSPERRSHPSVNVVLALFERDDGNEELARNLLRSVVAFLPSSPAEAAVSSPLTAWPRGLHDMITSGAEPAGGVTRD